MADDSRINIPVTIETGLSPELAAIARDVAAERADGVAWKVLQRRYGKSRQWLNQLTRAQARCRPAAANDA